MMKGLLLKDSYLTIKLCKAVLILAIVFIGVSIFSDNNAFFIAYPCLLSGLVPITLISYDEREKWNTYAATLPYTKAQIVSSKYIIGLIFSGVVLTMVALTQGYKMAANHSFVFTEYLGLLTVLLSICLIAPAILFPLVFKFGAEKGRILYYVLIGIVCAGGAILTNLDANIPAKISETSPVAIICMVAILLYALSWYLSIQFYKGREV